MVKIYFKQALRSLLKNKLFTFINLTGLIIGITSFLLIMLYVQYELSYDKFYKDADNIYRIYMDYLKGDQYEPGDAQVYSASGSVIKKEIPEVIDFVRLYRLEKVTFKYNNVAHEIANGHLVDSTYFNVFNTTLVRGNYKSVLSEPNTIVLTRKTAELIFGNDDPVGKTLIAFYGNSKIDLHVTGVTDNVPENTHMRTQFLISIYTNNNWDIIGSTLEPEWSNNIYFTYIKVDGHADISKLRKKIANLDLPIQDERHNLEPITDIHLYSDKPYEAETNGSASRIKFLLAIAIIVIIISWLNNINLTTSKSIEKAKEIGVRKVTGAKKAQLIIQNIAESVLLNYFALFLAIMLSFTLIPLLNSFASKDLISTLSINQTIIFLLAIPLTGILLSGLYPAILITRFNPVSVLKGKIHSASMNKRNSYRNGFVVIQFLITVVLLIGTFTIAKQIEFLDNQPVGADLNKVISIKGSVLDDKEDLDLSYETLKSELQKLPCVERVSQCATYPGENYEYMNYTMGMIMPDGSEDSHTEWYNFQVDEHFIPLMNIQMSAGESFKTESESNNMKLIINEEAAKKMGFTNYTDAIHKHIQVMGNRWEIIGVMNNYHHFGFKTKTPPLLLTYEKVNYGLLVKLDQHINSYTEINNAITQFNKTWVTIFPESLFKYNFIDEQFAQIFDEDKKFGKIFSFFTLIAIIIASIGLFGLAYSRCSKRIKEIGIRKVNGARIIEVLALLNKEFLLWVAIAFILATPIGFYVMKRWLENFEYKTEISWWIFGLSGILVFGITLLTVSLQSWKAATRNPVEALRYE